ncbi:MAG TPA: DUF2508 family protein [Clostridiaceae bacterium]|jgi:hypothetical protein|nr:DUF2508 family protein [Clostridiaceae bacterium]
MIGILKNNATKIFDRIREFDREKKEKKRLEMEYAMLQEELYKTNIQIRSAYNNFNNTTDKDCISYYLFLIKALEARYALLLKQAKDIDYA